MRQDLSPQRTDVLIRNARRVQLISTVAMALTAVASTILTIALGEYNFVGTVLMSILTLMGLTGLWMHRRGRYFTGVYILAGSVMTAGLALPFLVNGSGVNIGLAVILIVAGLAFYALPQERTGRLIVAGAVMGALSALIDLYTPYYLSKSNPVATLVFSILLLAVYVAFIVTRFNLFPLRGKLILISVLIAVVPVAILSIATNVTINRRLEREARNALQQSAQQTAGAIETALLTQLDVVRTEARLPDLVNFLQTPAEERTPEMLDQVSSVLTVLQRRDPIYISSYALLDRDGLTVADTDAAAVGLDRSDREYFLRARDTRLPYVSGIQYSPTSGTPSLYVSAPVSGPQGEFLGVLRARLEADLLQYILASMSRGTGQADQFHAVVDGTYYFVLADTGNPDNINRTYYSYNPEQLAYLRSIGLVSPDTTTTPTIDQPDMFTALQTIDRQPIFEIQADATTGQPLLIAAARLERSKWIVLAGQPLSLITEPIQAQNRTATTLAIAAAFLAALAAWIASAPIAGPVKRLTDTARAIASGDLSARALVETQDEVGVLAAAFNQMTDRLRETLAGLEERVRSRTAELEKTTRQSLKRAESLAAISEVSRALVSEQDLEKLLPLITRVVSQRFEFYHVGIFLLDEQRQFAVLRAANSEGGQRMLARGHQLRVGQEGIVGYVAATGRPRIALDVGADAVFFNNPDLPLTRSEMALPLILRGQTIGVLDVQSTVPQAFTEEDARTLAILADQVASAIDNATLFGETRAALAEAQALYSEYQAQAWRSVIRRRGVIGFQHGPAGSQPVAGPVEREEIEQAITAGDVVVTQPGAGTHPAVAVPIRLRDQTIGVLNIRASQPDHRWSTEEVELVRAVAGRVALALENARLLEETQQRANRERLVAEITTRIRSSNDPQTMIQIALEELKASLGATRVEIIPQTALPDSQA